MLIWNEGMSNVEYTKKEFLHICCSNHTGSSTSLMTMEPTTVLSAAGMINLV